MGSALGGVKGLLLSRLPFFGQGAAGQKKSLSEEGAMYV
jgi:hypothetical protein